MTNVAQVCAALGAARATESSSQNMQIKWSNLVKSSPSHFNHIFTLEGDKS